MRYETQLLITIGVIVACVATSGTVAMFFGVISVLLLVRVVRARLAMAAQDRAEGLCALHGIQLDDDGSCLACEETMRNPPR